MSEAWIEKRKTKKGIRRYVRWRNPDGTKGCKPAGPLKNTAIKIRNKTSEDNLHRNNNLGDPNKKVAELVDEYLASIEKIHEPSTYQFYKNGLHPFRTRLGGVRVIDLSGKILDTFQEDIIGEPLRVYVGKGKTKESSKFRSKNGAVIVMRCVRDALNYSVKRRDIAVSPVQDMIVRLKPKPVARFLNNYEKAKFFDSFKENIKLTKAVRLMLSTGMRDSELRSVDTHNIVNWQIKIWQRKTEKWKLIPIPENVRDVFEGEDGLIWEDWSKKYVQKQFNKYCEISGLGRIRPHDCRHTFASDYLQMGGNLKGLAGLLGVSLQTVQIYAHLEKDYNRDLVAKMEFVPNDLGKYLGNAPI